MEYVYAALLLHKAGKEINEANVEAVLKAAGIDVDSGRVKALVAALEGTDIEEAIKTAAVSVAPAAAAAAPAESAASTEPEKKEEEEEEDTEPAGLGALFG